MDNKIKKNFWKNKKVFITGHTGFKGSWLCIMLNLLGAQVTGYSLRPKTKPSHYELAKVKTIIKKSLISDVRNYKKLYNEIKKSKANIIFHLAAQPLVRYSYLNPKETFDTNINGTLNILECVRKIKRIKTAIIITSDKVYDITKNKVFNENDKLGGLDPYSSSKVCKEHLFSSYVNSFFSNSQNKRLATVRAGNVIGGGDYSKDRLIPDIFKALKKSKKIFIRNPDSTRPWQHVLEPLTGYLILAEKLYNNKIKNLNQNWNFGPNVINCKSVKYVTKKFADQLNLKVNYLKIKNKNIKKETRLLRLGNNKAKKFLNWYPKWNLDESIKKILEWNKLIKFYKPIEVSRNQIKDFLNN